MKLHEILKSLNELSASDLQILIEQSSKYLRAKSIEEYIRALNVNQLEILNK